MTISIREATSSDDDLGAVASIGNATSPEDPSSVDEMRWGDATYPGGKRFLATLDGRPVGAATIGRIYMYPPEFDGLWATINVLPDARGRGIGSQLLEALRGVASVAGKTMLHVPASAARPAGIAFLEHRGFVEYERSKSVRLELADGGRPSPPVPAGIVLTTLAADPALVTGVHQVALATFDDIPGGERPMAVGDLDEFRARDVDRAAIVPWGFVVALDGASRSVVGYAALALVPGSTTVAWHDMTAVLPAWRGRGLATAMKGATIAAARARGLTALVTQNDEENHAMRGVNARLGYLPEPDLLTMRGPVAAGIMDR